MAKKKHTSDTDAPEDVTPDAPETAAVDPEVPAAERVTPKPVPTFTIDDQGRLVSGDRWQKEFHVVYEGARWEHCAETADGYWIYQKS